MAPETKPDSWRPASSAERTELTLDSWAHSTQTSPRRYPFRCPQASPTDVQGELGAQHANDMGGTVQGQAHSTLERHGKASEAATLGCSLYLTSNQGTGTAQGSCAPSPSSLVGEGTPQSAPSLRVQGLNPTQVSLLFSLVAVRGARGRGRGDGNGGVGTLSVSSNV